MSLYARARSEEEVGLIIIQQAYYKREREKRAQRQNCVPLACGGGRYSPHAWGRSSSIDTPSRMRSSLFAMKLSNGGYPTISSNICPSCQSKELGSWLGGTHCAGQAPNIRLQFLLRCKDGFRGSKYQWTMNLASFSLQRCFSEIDDFHQSISDVSCGGRQRRQTTRYLGTRGVKEAPYVTMKSSICGFPQDVMRSVSDRSCCVLFAKTTLPGCRSERVTFSRIPRNIHGYLTDLRAQCPWHECIQVLAQSASTPPKRYFLAIDYLCRIQFRKIHLALIARGQGMDEPH